MTQRHAIKLGRIQDVAGRVWEYEPDVGMWRWGDSETAVRLTWINMLAFRPFSKPWKELK